MLVCMKKDLNMRQKFRYHFTFLFECLLLLGCTDPMSSNYMDKSPDKRYYETDIINRQFVHFYPIIAQHDIGNRCVQP